MTNIEHEITINSSIAKVFAALDHVDGLKKWHSANIEGNVAVNQSIVIKGVDKPTFIWKIIVLDPGHRMVWECQQGPGDAVGTKVAYSLSATEDGRVLVECSHMHWPDAHGHYRKCNTLWGILLHHLKQYAETGVSSPAF